MKSALRILLLEDSPLDAEIITREIRAVANVTRCDSRASFGLILGEQWDAAIVDLSLPDFSGQEAIQMLKTTHPDLPVIIITGSVGAAEADAACLHGARRFFLKQDLHGLDRALVDACENRRLARESLRDQRLEILGNLATGIVHDVNGILQVFTMGVPLLREDGGRSNARILDQMESAANRGAELTAQILTFARGKNGNAFKSISVPYLLGEIGGLVKATFPANIQVDIKTAIGTSPVLCDAVQIAQVLQNLAINARDAMMPEGGTLRIHAQNVSRVEPLIGPRVEISVEDTGHGIPDNVLPNIFMPFFSTKPPGSGTGLGLATVKRIVEAHHGMIDVRTGPGGTTFNVYLPVALPWISAPDKSPDGDEGSKTILLVDDDVTLREFTQLLLESAGYRILTAGNGVEALKLFRTVEKIDLLLTDRSMPLMDGAALVKKLRAEGTRTPVLMLSGYDSPALDDVEASVTLRKPVSRETLLKTIKDALTVEMKGR